jgi:hypothetical protein
VLCFLDIGTSHKVVIRNNAKIYFKLTTCLIDSRKLMSLVGLTCVRNIIKFELQKGMKKRLLIAQGMADMNSW